MLPLVTGLPLVALAVDYSPPPVLPNAAGTPLSAGREERWGTRRWPLVAGVDVVGVRCREIHSREEAWRGGVSMFCTRVSPDRQRRNGQTGSNGNTEKGYADVPRDLLREGWLPIRCILAMDEVDHKRFTWAAAL